MFDAGNALFQAEGVVGAAPTARAGFVLSTLGKLGVKVMPAGARDLNDGAAWLKAQAKAAGIQVLSANLREKGKPVFDATLVLTHQGVKFGFAGLSPVEIAARPELKGEPLVASAREALKKLDGKCEVKVLLAAVKYADALQLSDELKTEVDLIITSGEVRGASEIQPGQGNLLIPSGQRGQALAKLTLKLAGKGPFIDTREAEREKQVLDNLEQRLKEMSDRLAAAKDKEAKAALSKTVAEVKARRDEQKKRFEKAQGAKGRTASLDWMLLDTSVKDDEALKAEVLKIEPTYAGAH